MTSRNIGVAIKPTQMKIGGWVETEYDRRLIVDDRTWYHVTGGFGERNDRDDWVLDLPEDSISVNVSKYKNEKLWNHAHKTMKKAMESAIEDARSRAKSELKILIAATIAMKKAIKILE